MGRADVTKSVTWKVYGKQSGISGAQSVSCESNYARSVGSKGWEGG